MANKYKKTMGTYKNITNWMDPNGFTLTVKGEVPNVVYCEREAERWKACNCKVKVGYNDDGLVAVLHDY